MVRYYVLMLFFPLLLYSQGTWTGQTSNTGNLLRSVSFVDAETGWAVGDAGTIRKTIDGGQSWISQSAGTTIDLEAVHFIDETTGWVAGQSGLILHTSDGGSTWTVQTSAYGGHLRDVFFADPVTGWIAGSSETILNTTDGGETWTIQLSGQINNLRKIRFADNYTGWAVGDGGTIFHTNDGGENWIDQQSGTSSGLSSVCFVDAETGWLTAWNGSILKTTDGGETWNIVYNAGVDLYSIYFTDENTGWAAGNFGSVFHSSDGGATWSQQTSGTSSWLWEIDFADPNTGWAVGMGGTIIYYYEELSLNAPELLTPENGSEDLPLVVSFQWEPVPEADSYRLQVATTYAFSTKIYDKCGITGTSASPEDLSYQTTYYWRVNASGDEGTSQWSEVWSFTTEEDPLVGVSNRDIPAGYTLMQNYPNPFNPSTTIRYGLPERSSVKIEIFNTLGQHVATLVNARLEAGYHDVDWYSGRVASGMYFYRIEAVPVNNQSNRFVEVKSMLLLK